MGYGATKRCLRRRSFIDVDKLMIFGAISEYVDSVLINGNPLSGGNFVPTIAIASDGSTN